MRYSNVSEPRRHALHVLAVATAIVAMIGRVGNSREPTRGPMDHVPGWNEQAHIHNIDMSCCAPCAPETNTDPDVFKRPCFTRALAKSRKGFDAYLGLTNVEEVRISQQAIPVESIAGFEAMLTSLLQPGFLPAAWDRANFQVPYQVNSVTEVRGGITTFVGHAVDRTAVAANEISPRDPIQGAWTIGGIEVLPRTPNIVDRPTRAVIRLRLHGAERLTLKPRPPEFIRAGVYADNFGDFFDKAAFHRLLTKVLRIPFAAPTDLMLDGYDAEHEGVRVFVGKIRSREWDLARKTPNPDRTPPHWWDEMQLLVTDSDPQYFCVSIVLGRDDAVPAPQP